VEWEEMETRGKEWNGSGRSGFLQWEGMEWTGKELNGVGRYAMEWAKDGIIEIKGWKGVGGIGILVSILKEWEGMERTGKEWRRWNGNACQNFPTKSTGVGGCHECLIFNLPISLYLFILMLLFFDIKLLCDSSCILLVFVLWEGLRSVVSLEY